jgi:hypothetical protein
MAYIKLYEVILPDGSVYVAPGSRGMRAFPKGEAEGIALEYGGEAREAVGWL